MRTIYHGTQVYFETPVFGRGNPHNDYGLGFYCTEDELLAEEWACRYSTNGFVNHYSIKEKGLKILDLTSKEFSILHWVALLIRNRSMDESYKEDHAEEIRFLDRYLFDLSSFDVVIGYRADDSYFRFPRLFLENRLTLQGLTELFETGELGKQYVLLSEKAFSQIRFLKRSKARPKSNQAYLSRMKMASEKVRSIELEDRLRPGARIRDLINDHA